MKRLRLAAVCLTVLWLLPGAVFVAARRTLFDSQGERRH